MLPVTLACSMLRLENDRDSPTAEAMGASGAWAVLGLGVADTTGGT